MKPNQTKPNQTKPNQTKQKQENKETSSSSNNKTDKRNTPQLSYWFVFEYLQTFCVMTDTTKPYSLIAVWMTSTSIQASSCLRKQYVVG